MFSSPPEETQHVTLTPRNDEAGSKEELALLGKKTAPGPPFTMQPLTELLPVCVHLLTKVCSMLEVSILHLV